MGIADPKVVIRASRNACLEQRKKMQEDYIEKEVDKRVKIRLKEIAEMTRTRKEK